MLNVLWLSFFAIAFVSGCYHWLVLGDAAIWQAMTTATFDMAKAALDISLGLVGVLSLWLGLFAVGREAGLVAVLARGLSPLLSRLMPDVPRHHPAFGSMTMNMAANILGLDNAATPLGLQAMRDLQSLNTKPDTATNAQILFLVMNASSLTLLPVTIFMYRAQMGAADPASVFIPILLATSCSTLMGILSVAWVQRLPLLNPIVLAYFVGFAVLISGLGVYLSSLAADAQATQSALIGNFLIFLIIILFLFAGWRRKIAVYDVFIEGAKEGFSVAIGIIPYLVAMLVAIGVLRASGALDGALWLIREGITTFHFDTRFVDALPTALIKPFSGSGARAMMLETMQTHGVDSFAGRLSAIIQGSTETTFYVLAVYFGSVGITKARHAIACALLADLAGVLAAIAICYSFFG